MRFLILGLGGWISPPLLDTVSILVEINDKMILLDCGEGVSKQIARLGIDIERLSLLVLSHAHGDHILSFPSLVLQLRYRGYSKRLTVVGLSGTLRVAQELARLTGVDRHLCLVQFVSVEKDSIMDKIGKILENEDFEIYSTVVKHSIDCMAVKIVDKRTGHTLVYSGDTAPCENIVELSRDADVVIHEATCSDPTAHQHGHSTLRDAIEIAEKARAKVLVPVHYYASGEVVSRGSSNVCILIPSPGVWFDVGRLVSLCQG